MQDIMVFTVREVAKQLKVSHQTTLKLLRNGTIGAIRAGHQWRVTGVSLAAFLRSGGNGSGKSGAAHKRAA
jgi:excisionase family DNA binding protein